MYDFDLFGEGSGLCKPQLSPVGRQRRSDLWRGLPATNWIYCYYKTQADKHKKEDKATKLDIVVAKKTNVEMFFQL